MPSGNSDFRHFIGILSIFWGAFSIFNDSLKQMDYTVVMFLLANYATVAGFPLKKNYDTRNWRMFSKIVKYVTWFLGIIYFLDSSREFMINFVEYPKVISALIIGFIGTLFFILQSRCVSVDVVEKAVDRLSQDVVEQFKDVTQEFIEYINKHGGIKNLDKNPQVNEAMRLAVRLARKKWPQDHNQPSGKHSRGKKR